MLQGPLLKRREIPVTLSAMTASCPFCQGQAIRYGASAWRHLVRSLTGSRKRHCLACEGKWIDRRRRMRAHPLSGREWRQIAARAGLIPLGALIGYLLFAAVRARQASAEAQAEAYLPYHVRYLQTLAARSDDGFYSPFASSSRPRISSRFGYRIHPIYNDLRFHDGVDLALPLGTPVFPARDGKVVEAGWAGNYGLRVSVRHADGETSVYGHLERITVSVGDGVEARKTLLGRVGSTGLSTGPHLHFELRDPQGRRIDPLDFLPRQAAL